MATHDDLPTPTAAEQAYLSSRHTVRISPADPEAGSAEAEPASADAANHEDDQQHDTVQPDQLAADQPVPDPPAGQSARGRRAPVALAAAVAACSAAAVVFVPAAAVVFLLQVVETGQLQLAGPLRLTVAGWLLAHGVPLQVGSGTLGLFPLAVTVLVWWRLARAGVHVTRAIGARQSGSWRRALVAASAIGAAYGLIGLVATAVAAGGGWWAEPLRAAAAMTLVGFVAAGCGSLQATGALGVLLARLPTMVRHGVRTGAVAAVLVLAGGAAAAGVAVAVGGGGAADMLAAYGTGPGGQAGLMLLCLAYAPNLAVWAAAYLLGPGFALGADTVVRSSEVVVGPLPALPVLAGLPDSPLPAVGAALLVVPTIAGGLAGWLLSRVSSARPAWRELLGAALIAGPVAGLVLGLAAAAAGGSLGSAQLAVLGPVPWLIAAWGTVLVAPGALLGVAVTAMLLLRKS